MGELGEEAVDGGAEGPSGEACPVFQGDLVGVDGVEDGEEVGGFGGG